ncbi:MAG: putative toxin-antitoxin system toxin component, PIN family [Nitrospirota bacterium]
MIPRVVLDTNTLVSALLFGGTPREVLNCAHRGEIHMLVSPHILSELGGILLHKLQRPLPQVEQALRTVAALATTVHPTITLSVIPNDDVDNRIIECAVAGGAGLIVTGDHALLRLRRYEDIGIVSARQFLDVLKGLR